MKIKSENYKQIPASKLRSEKEIIDCWQGSIDKIAVSISCITYNHEDYIEDAIIGFLRQETDFPFEVLIHDDASTDNTANIIRAYESLYPQIIKVIYQTENQYSQGKKPGIINRARAKGQYIAVCEGDDYWICNNKLALQKELLDSNPSISIVYHHAYVMNKHSVEGWKSGLDFSNDVALVGLKDVLKVKGQFAATASYFFRSKVCEVSDPILARSPVGDFVIEVYSQKVGKGIYIDKYLSVYRKTAKGNWSTRRKPRGASYDFAFRQYELHLEILRDFPDISPEDMACRTHSLRRVIALHQLKVGNRTRFFKYVDEPNGKWWQLDNAGKILLLARRNKLSFNFIFALLHVRELIIRVFRN